MADLCLLRFPISGRDSEYVLIQVLSNGSKPLDIKILGTDGADVFSAKIRHKRANELKASTGHCNDEEWEQILGTTLVDQKGAHDIEIKADVQSGKDITLNFRKNIQGITQRLGSIKLKEDAANEPIELFDWCSSVIGSRAKAAEDLGAATAKAEALERSVVELKSQLEELIKAKEDDETQLLEKFRDLLNAKKLKIRQQQRQLASASVDPDKLANFGASQNTVRKAKASRITKRKVAESSSSDSDDGFEKMDVDQRGNNSKAPEVESELDPRRTTDDETQSEADDSDGAGAPVSTAKWGGKRAIPSRAAKAEPPMRKNPPKKLAATEKAQSPVIKDEEEAPPPRRNLPFNKGKKPPPPAPVDDETDSDDAL